LAKKGGTPLRGEKREMGRRKVKNVKRGLKISPERRGQTKCPEENVPTHVTTKVLGVKRPKEAPYTLPENGIWVAQKENLGPQFGPRREFLTFSQALRRPNLFNSDMGAYQEVSNQRNKTRRISNLLP